MAEWKHLLDYTGFLHSHDDERVESRKRKFDNFGVNLQPRVIPTVQGALND